ncbi:hypothetical protein JCM11251_001867 [Rhodosporidiobolus azoricus]
MAVSSLPSASHPALGALLPPSLLDHFHLLRVTSQASLNNLVGFALGHLSVRFTFLIARCQLTPIGKDKQQPSPPPLVLHCLPSPAALTSSADSATAGPPPVTTFAQDVAERQAKTAETSMAALPKLVSVCEIIKREWFSVLPPSSSSTVSSDLSTSAAPPSPSLRETKPEDQREGLHQYTLLTTLEALKLADPDGKGKKAKEEEEMEAVESELVKMNWLTGGAGRRKRPRRKHSPCMIIVLSPSPVSSLTSSTGWTYQPPLPPPKPKKRPSPVTEAPAADSKANGEGKKKRRRRRRKGSKNGKMGEEVGNGKHEMDVDPASEGGCGGEDAGEE